MSNPNSKPGTHASEPTNPSVPQSNKQPTQPAASPARYRWGKRCLVLTALLTLGLTALWVWADVATRHRFEQQVAAIQAKGQPTQAEDLNLAAIPDADNKAFYLVQAFPSQWPKVPGTQKLITETEWNWSGGMDNETDQPLPDPITDSAAYLAQCQPLVEAIFASKKATQVHWGAQYKKHAVHNTMPPAISELRQTAWLLSDAAERHTSLNQIDQALACVQAIFLLSEGLTAKQFPSVLDHIVANGLEAVGVEQLQTLYPHLTQDQRPAIKHLMLDLLDEAALTESLNRTMFHEQVAFLDVLDAIESQPNTYTPNGNGRQSPPSLWHTWLEKAQRPLYQNDAAWSLALLSEQLEIIQDLPNEATFKQRASKQPILQTDPFNTTLQDQSWLYPIASNSLANAEFTAHRHFRCITQRRMAAVALAIKLHEFDHGQRPATLDALVPEYLDAIPLDPTTPQSSQGVPLAYLPEGCTFYRSEDHEPPYHRKEESPMTWRPDPSKAMPTPGPAVLHSLGPNRIQEQCPIEVSDDGTMLDRPFDNTYGHAWFALDPWPTFEPTPEYLEREANGDFDFNW